MDNDTKELRRMLDERGIEYETGFGGSTLWTGRYGVDWCWEEAEGALVTHEQGITPEEAIDITLGNKGIAESLDEMSELRAENAKLWKLLQGFLSEHPDYLTEVIEVIGSLDLEHAIQHDQEYYRRKAKKLGIEVE